MGKVPERIWLQIDTDPESEWYDEIIVTWCADQINDDDIEYVLATRISELEVENADLKETIEIHDMNFTMLLEKSAIRASELKSDLEVEEKLTEYYADKAENLQAENERLLNAVKLAYRKHHLDDRSVGWEELSDALFNTLCDAMGDIGFDEWLKKQRKGCNDDLGND